MAAGIVKKLDSSNRSYYKVDDIVKLLDVSQSKAYNMIREMRQECIDTTNWQKLSETQMEHLRRCRIPCWITYLVNGLYSSLLLTV